MQQVVPLDPSELEKSLGPGYRKGWYGWKKLGERRHECDIGSINSTYTRSIRFTYQRVKREIRKRQPYETFCKFLEKKYHSKGHMVIAKACSPTFEPRTNEGLGIMAFSEVSARDPIFYRWHRHIEDVVQEYRNTQLP